MDLHNIAYKKHLSDLDQSISVDSKKFWSFIQSTKWTSRIPSLMIYKGNELSDPSEIVDAFEDFFDRVFIASKSMEYYQLIFNTNSNISIPQCQIHIEGVLI